MADAPPESLNDLAHLPKSPSVLLPRGKLDESMASGPVRPINTAPMGTPALVPKRASEGISPEPPSGVSPTVTPAVAPNPAMPRSCSVCQNNYPADFLICPRDGTPLELQ